MKHLVFLLLLVTTFVNVIAKDIDDYFNLPIFADRAQLVSVLGGQSESNETIMHVLGTGDTLYSTIFSKVNRFVFGDKPFVIIMFWWNQNVLSCSFSYSDISQSDRLLTGLLEYELSSNFFDRENDDDDVTHYMSNGYTVTHTLNNDNVCSVTIFVPPIIRRFFAHCVPLDGVPELVTIMKNDINVLLGVDND